jgi:CheY-like chemotaxis protein
MSNSQARRTKILLVDDEIPILELLREILEPDGYDLSSAENGADALAMVLESDFDLIITDFRMPKLSGRQLFEEAKVGKPGIEKRFLFISGEMDPETKTEYIRESGVRVIAKPFKADLVREAVQEVLEASG